MPRERESVAPPRPSVAPASIPPPGGAPSGAGARQNAKPAPKAMTPSRLPAVLVVLVLGVAAADWVTAIRGTVSVAATAALSALVLPWALIVLRGALRTVAFHFVNLIFVVAFSAAKWLVLLDALKLGAAPYVGSYRSYTAALVVLLLVGIALRGGRIAQLVAASAERPARLMAASFGLTAVVGALLLALPTSLHDVGEVSLLDSLFMSTSAVCVTGLTTVNVANTYTFSGQIVLCILMQLGGLGIMVLTAAVTMLAGRRLGVKSSAVLAEMVDASSLADLKRTISMIVSYTLVFEAIGAALLYLQLRAYPADSFLYYADGGLGGSDSALWAAVFHSVSAFCNGSLSNFRDGMGPFANSPAFCQTISVLIVLGGLGFPVIHELLFRWVDRLRGHRPLRLTLNTRVALTTTAGLLVSVAVLTFALESGASFKDFGVGARINAAVFHSACSRTSGFNLVDVGTMRPATLLLTCFAMFVGAGSGSTAGGIKVTTMAVLFAAFRGELRGQRARLFDRSIPDAVVRRAMGVAFLSTVLVVVVVFLVLLSDNHEPLSVLFETVSAFSTTGMSTGITPRLSAIGKLLIILTMLIGRIGPLTAALAFSANDHRPAHTLPQERLMIG